MMVNPSSTLKTCIDMPIDEKKLIDLVTKAKDWAIMHGAAMRSKTHYDSDSLNFAPFILTPSPFPRAEFNKALELQPMLNELVHTISNDDNFLRDTLAETIRVDEFTRKLFEIYDKVLRFGSAQDTITCGLIRSDYLAHCTDDNSIKQVEINTIASSFGGISTNIKPLQSYVLGEVNEYDKLKDLPENKALAELCNGIIKAWIIFNNTKAVVLFVIEDISYNICDQRFHEFKIRKMNPKIQVIRKTLTEISKEASHGPNRELIIDGQIVGVIYFRAGYEPNHYPTQKEWNARLLMELSTAIKCPNIQYHLAGTKKVQQALANPGVLERFVSDPSIVEVIRRVFTGLYPLEKSKEGDAAYKMAMAHPEKYVMKPQREGGGNNIYGVNIPEALNKMTDDERSAWILMDRINPPTTKGYMIRPGDTMPPPIVDLVSELGVFGVIIADKNKIYSNYMAGHMLRTKLSTTDEGGVAAGHGALDSPYLID